MIEGLGFNGEKMEQRLELNTDILNEKQENYNSLTDLNNLNLFTEEFSIYIEHWNNEKTKLEQELRNQCFVEGQNNNSDEKLVSQLFQESGKQIDIQQIQSQDYSNYYMFMGSLFVGIVICALVFGITGRKGSYK
ncbi:MAG: hypothetical protein NC124_21140 [Clostridium sp.]|nr:hypothetical protein [Clostridium sp.]